MVALKAELRFFGFGTLSMLATLVAMLLIFALDGPLNLRTFDWPTPEEDPALRADNVRHFLIVGFLIVVVAGLVASWLLNTKLLPVPASAESRSIDGLLSGHFVLIGVLFALVSVFMLYSIIVFRRREGDTEEGVYFHGNTTLEIVWTVLPLALVLYFGYWGVKSLKEVTAPQPDALVVEVEAAQWSWNFTYPEYGIEHAAELTLPAGRQVLLKMHSKDVIHSFWVPEFRVKQDVVPGRETHLRVTPSLEGTYKLRCAEICGTAHSTMLATVNVLPADEFEAWATGAELAAADLTPEQRGAEVANAQGCLGCHSVDGTTLVGPTWLGLYGKAETLEDGSTVTVDDDYLRRSIREPLAQIVEGYPPAMPTTYADANLLPDEDVEALIAYIKSLQ